MGRTARRTPVGPGRRLALGPALRADRAGQGDGRVYRLTFEATDPAGAACTGTVTVCVPHDRRGLGCGEDAS